MIDDAKIKKWMVLLVGYYGVLQFFHLVSLARAGFILVNSGRVPFPASPPLGGWSAEVLPFLMGMGAADVVAASLGIYFSWSLLFKKELRALAGIISLTIALSSGVVYLVGTYPSGAWSSNPVSYLVVLAVFSPVIPLFIGVLRLTAQKLTSLPE